MCADSGVLRRTPERRVKAALAAFDETRLLSEAIQRAAQDNVVLEQRVRDRTAWTRVRTHLWTPREMQAVF